MNTCLIVIDAQESFRHRPYFAQADSATSTADYLAAQNALIEGCVARGVPVLRVLHSDGPARADNPFALESGHVRPITGLVPFEPAASFLKRRHSSLVGTGLDVWLVENGIRRVIVSGIRTEQCCETTTRHASDLGYEVDFVDEATLTWDMPQADGTLLRAGEIRSRTAMVLKDRFARIASVDEALAALDEQDALAH